MKAQDQNEPQDQPQGQPQDQAPVPATNYESVHSLTEQQLEQAENLYVHFHMFFNGTDQRGLNQLLMKMLAVFVSSEEFNHHFRGGNRDEKEAYLVLFSDMVRAVDFAFSCMPHELQAENIL